MLATVTNDLDENIALARVRDCFPELGAQRAQLLGGRLVRSFLVDDAIVFRFPINRDAAAMLDAEVRLLRALAPNVPATIPDHRYHAPGIWGHPVLPGSPARDRFEELGAKLGHALAAIHTFPIATVWACGLRHRREPHNNLAVLFRDLILRYDGVRPTLPAQLQRRCDQHFAEMEVPPPHVGALGLIHGSISPKTVHVTEPIGLAAWEEANIGDVALDLGCVLFAFGRSALDAALATMPQKVGVAERARFIARCYGLSLVTDSTIPIAAKVWALDRIT